MANLPKIEPMVLSLLPEPFDHPDWIFELKHDGFRAVAYIANGTCELISRRRNVYQSYKQLQAGIAGTLPVQGAILDGEICCLDSAGRSMFNELLFRRGFPIFYAFDLLWLNGKDLRGEPLHSRKQKLQQLVARADYPELLFAQHIEERGISLFRLACKKDTEGIVAKRKNGTYTPGERWFKVKNKAYSQVVGRHELFDSLRPLKSAVRTAKPKRRAG